MLINFPVWRNTPDGFRRAIGKIINITKRRRRREEKIILWIIINNPPGESGQIQKFA
jgi:hypothetical protein